MSIIISEDPVLNTEHRDFHEQLRTDMDRQAELRCALYREILSQFGLQLAEHNLKVTITGQPTWQTGLVVMPPLSREEACGRPLSIHPPFDRAWTSSNSDESACWEPESLFPRYGSDEKTGKSAMLVCGKQQSPPRWAHSAFEMDLQVPAHQLYAVSFDFEVLGSYTWALNQLHAQPHACFSAEVKRTVYECQDGNSYTAILSDTPWSWYQSRDANATASGTALFNYRSGPLSFYIQSKPAKTYLLSLALSISYSGQHSEGMIEGGLTIL